MMGVKAHQVSESAAVIHTYTSCRPDIGFILGSGLGELADQIQSAVTIPFREIPHFAVPTVSGHQGELIIGELEGRPVVAMRGRLHYYEGWEMDQVTFPVYVMRQLGVQLLILTNAAGGLNPAFSPGDLMLISDHLNLTGDHPLIGDNDEWLGPRFPDMSRAYDRSASQCLKRVAKQLSIRLQEGIYAGISGPNYLSMAELRALLHLGADALGMSTVAEAIAASHCGLKVLGISCITDMANPDLLEPPTHEQVLRVAESTKPAFISLLRGFVRAFGEESMCAHGN